MANPKYTFESLAGNSRYYSHDTGQVAGDKRYINHYGWRFWEDGRVQTDRTFSRDPLGRNNASEVMGVRIKLANALPKFATLDGMPVPKTWLRDNPAVLWDTEHNLVFRVDSWLDGPVTYVSRHAEPYQTSTRAGCGGFTVHVPDPAKVKRVYKDPTFQRVWMKAYAAWRLEDGKGTWGGPISESDLQWVNSLTDDPPQSVLLSIKWRNKAQVMGWLKACCTVAQHHDRLKVITN